jgi:dipeptidyl aminopeptidase/acylaminoacyl peptidase
VLYATNRRNGVDFDVVLRTVSSGAETVVWDGGGWVNEATISPDGRHIAMLRESELPASSLLMLADTTTGAVETITDPDQAGDWRQPRWLDGAVLSSSDAGAEFHSVRRYDLAAKTWTILLDADGSNREAWPSPDGRRLAVVTTDDGADRLAVYDIAVDSARSNGSVPTPTLRGRVEIALPHAGVITSRSQPHWSPDSSELGMTFSSPIQPPEVYVRADGTAERRTVSNPQLATVGLVEPQSHRVPTPDGEHVPVYVFPGGSSAVLSIHGGPEWAVQREWSALHAALSLAGFTVVAPNVRGSYGYGRRWISLDDVELRLDSVADLAAIHAWLPSIGVEPDRAALYGGSYGGYMVLAGLAFQPELWAAGVDIVGISSLVTFLENTSAYRRAYREREYGTLADDREFLEKASPLTRIGDMRAPLFIIHGANDPRVPLSEAEQIESALRERGIECELLVYPDEGHGLAKRANRLDAYPRAIAFLTRHLAGS